MGRSPGFGWSDLKDERNLAKHGMPLRFAVLLFGDDRRLEKPAKTIHGELRFIAVGRIGERVLSCVYTYADGDRQLLSLRPASRKERRSYAANLDHG